MLLTTHFSSVPYCLSKILPRVIFLSRLREVNAHVWHYQTSCHVLQKALHAEPELALDREPTASTAEALQDSTGMLVSRRRRCLFEKDG